MKSIVQENKECFLTGAKTGLHKHHIFGGAYRKKSEQFGLTVYLLAELHNLGKNSVHQNKELNDIIKRTGQRAFERIHGSRADFMALFGKNYLEAENE